MTARIAIADKRPNATSTSYMARSGQMRRWRRIWRDRGKLCAGAQYGAQRRIEARIGQLLGPAENHGPAAPLSESAPQSMREKYEAAMRAKQ
jgi:hypothetical protein